MPRPTPRARTTGTTAVTAAVTTAACRRFAPVLPVVALIAMLALPVGGASAEGGGGGGGSGFGATAADAVSGLVVLYAAGRAFRSGRRPLTRTAALVLGLPVVGITVAAAGAVDTATGFSGLGRYLQVFVLVPAAVVLLIRDRADFRLLAWSFVALALWQGGLGVHQYATGSGASYMGSDVRAVGTFGATDVMGMATVVAYGLVCAVGLALGPPAGAVRPAFRRVAPPRGIALVCAVLLLVPLALSFSRGAWIATALACGAQLVLAGVRRAVRVFAVLAALGVLLVGGMGVGTAMLQERVDSISHVADTPDQSVVDRYTMWAAAVGIWRENPVAGVGLKAFPEYRDSHATLALSSGSDTAGAGAGFRRQPLLSPHNMYLLVLGEQGLLGAVTLLGGWAALLVAGLARATAARGRTAGWNPGSARGGVRCGGEVAVTGCGLLLWQLVDFAYSDIGGPATVLTAVVLGVAAWWSLGAAEDHGPTGTPDTDADTHPGTAPATRTAPATSPTPGTGKAIAP